MKSRNYTLIIFTDDLQVFGVIQKIQKKKKKRLGKIGKLPISYFA